MPNKAGQKSKKVVSRNKSNKWAGSPPFNWIETHADGTTTLELAFLGPKTLMASLTVGVGWSKAARRQADQILRCLRNILPNKKNPSEWQFIIRVVDEGEPASFRIVRKGEGRCGPGEYRARWLNLAPRDWRYFAGEDELMETFFETYFGHTPSPAEMAVFMLKPKNFDETSGDLHEASR